MAMQDISRSKVDPDHPIIPQALAEASTKAKLHEKIRDAFFPALLPPLELSSTSVLISEPFRSQVNPWVVGTATAINAVVLALLFCLGTGVLVVKAPKTVNSHVSLNDLNIFALTKMGTVSHGGGGGGSHDQVAPIRGHLPKIDKTPLLPPQTSVVVLPKLAVNSAVALQPDIRLPDNSSMPTVGLYESTNVQVVLGGPGDGAGIGTGRRGGLGSGDGSGIGPGEDGGYGDGIDTPGLNGVTQPVPLVTPEAEFSDEARRQKYQGLCVVEVIVDARGNPQNPRVVRHLGLGLDEKAVEAVLHYRFKPATKQGRPVPVLITVAVNFHLLY
jgi:periplasmic protein TonB